MTQVGWVKYVTAIGETGWSFLEAMAETEDRRGRRAGGRKWVHFRVWRNIHSLLVSCGLRRVSCWRELMDDGRLNDEQETGF